MADLKAIAEELVNLTVKDVNELATILKDEYGIEPAAAAVAVAAGPAAAGEAAAEKDSFDVVLTLALLSMSLRYVLYNVFILSRCCRVVLGRTNERISYDFQSRLFE